MKLVATGLFFCILSLIRRIFLTSYHQATINNTSALGV